MHRSVAVALVLLNSAVAFSPLPTRGAVRVRHPAARRGALRALDDDDDAPPPPAPAPAPAAPRMPEVPKMPDLPKMDMPEMPKLDLPKLDLPDLGLPNFDLPNFGGEGGGAGGLAALTEGDAVFKTHTVAAGALAALLLLVGGADKSLFLLAVAYVALRLDQEPRHDPLTHPSLPLSYLCNSAPALTDDAKQLLARTFTGLCAAEALLMVLQLFTGSGGPLYLVVDFVSLVVYAFVAYAYYASGLLGKE